MTKILVDSELLEAVAKCIDSAIDYSQRDFDHPPEPTTEWDFNAGVLVAELRAALNAPQQEAVATLIEPPLDSMRDQFWVSQEDAERLAKLPGGTKLYTHPAPSVPEDWQLIEECRSSVKFDLNRYERMALDFKRLGVEGKRTYEMADAEATRLHALLEKIDAMLSAASKTLRDGEPCSHPGCLSHVSHPCEGCGRVAGMAPKAPTTDDRKDAERFFPFEFEVWQNDEMVASASGPQDTALSEAMHYATQYQQDGPVRVFEVTRTLVAAIAAQKGEKE